MPDGIPQRGTPLRPAMMYARAHHGSTTVPTDGPQLFWKEGNEMMPYGGPAGRARENGHCLVTIKKPVTWELHVTG